MRDILNMNRVAVVIFLAMLAVVVYDSLRTPAYIQHLEVQGYNLDKDAFNNLNPPVPEESGKKIALYETLLNEIERDLGNALPATELYDTALIKYKKKYASWEISITPPEQDYTEAQREIIQAYLEVNKEALQQIYSRFPIRLYFDSKALKSSWLDIWVYREVPRLIAVDGLNAIMENNQKVLHKSINTLNKLAELYTTDTHEHYLSHAAEDNYDLARYALQKIAFLINNAINRTEVPDELLLQWQGQFSTPAFLSSDNLVKALEFSNREFLLSYLPDNQMASGYSWHSVSSVLELCGASTRYFKTIAPEISRNILNISQASPKSIPTLNKKFNDVDYDRVYTGYELNYDADSGAIGDYLYMNVLASFIRTGIALYRYGQDHGEFPVTLQQLIPKYLDAVPENPYEKNVPLQYHQEEDRVSIFMEEGGTPFTLLEKVLTQPSPATENSNEG